MAAKKTFEENMARLEQIVTPGWKSWWSSWSGATRR